MNTFVHSGIASHESKSTVLAMERGGVPSIRNFTISKCRPNGPTASDRMLAGSRTVDGSFLAWINGTRWSLSYYVDAFIETYSKRILNDIETPVHGRVNQNLSVVTIVDDNRPDDERQMIFALGQVDALRAHLTPMWGNADDIRWYADDPASGVRYVMRPSRLDFNGAIIDAARAPGAGPGSFMCFIDDALDAINLDGDVDIIDCWVPFTVISALTDSCVILTEDRRLINIERVWDS